MRIIFFIHPSFLTSQSMPRYANMLSNGLSKRGYVVEQWTAKPILFKLPSPLGLKKWLGYIDQFIFFPLQVKRRIKKCPPKTLFVFTDQALGPWVSLVSKRNHIIHCHDFLAQNSALGTIQDNKIKWSGKLYQQFIRWGYRKGENFISISKNTQADLHSFLKNTPNISEVVYNGLNQNFTPSEDKKNIRIKLSKAFNITLNQGFILHVGGNQFYKNRKGVIEIYAAWCQITKHQVPLLMIGATPTKDLLKQQESSPYKSDIHFITFVDDHMLRRAYQAASVFLFPSLAEGFGWPIAEAQASGCIVITTDEAPMNEVAQNSAILIKKRPYQTSLVEKWAKDSAKLLENIMNFTKEERTQMKNAGIENAKRFNTEDALDKVESTYIKLMNQSK